MNSENYKPKKTPTIVVNATDFFALAYERAASYTIRGARKGKRMAGNKAQPLSENEVVFLGSPKEIKFRKRWSFSTVKREVRYIMGDRSDRFNILFTIFFK